MSWIEASLGDLISYIGKGIAPKYTEDASSPNSVLVLGQKCVRNQKIDYSQGRYHDKELKVIKPAKIAAKGDILINATGVGSAGRIAQIIHNPQRECVTDGHVITLRASSRINPYYLGYFIKSKQTVIEQLAEGSTGQTEMNRSRLQNEILVTFPESDEDQRRIAEFGLVIDKKIAQNAKLNGYLEKLVSLEFSRRFKASTPTIELGKVLSISTESIKPQEHAGEIWEHYSIPAYDENRQPLFELSDGIKSNKYAIDANCILISKLNPATKRIWMPSCTSEHSVCSTEFIVYKPKNPKYKSFYYAAIDSQVFTDFLIAHVTGSTGSRQRTQPKATLTYTMPNPGHDAIEGFCAFADPIYKQIQSNRFESQWLVSLRDALLPKLMSGEIDVSKIDLTQLNSHLEKRKAAASVLSLIFPIALPGLWSPMQ